MQPTQATRNNTWLAIMLLDMRRPWTSVKSFKKTPKFLGVFTGHIRRILGCFFGGLKSMTVSATNHDLLFSYPTSRNQPNKSNDLLLNFSVWMDKCRQEFEKTVLHHLFRFHVQESHSFFSPRRS